MTEPKGPPSCHFDRTLGIRVTAEHRDDCPHQIGTGDCPAAGNGCAPCTAPHCLVCGTVHATNDHPDTCTDCIAKVRADLHDIDDAHAALRIEAHDAGADGRLVAAAPIPGGNAAVLVGPSVRRDHMRTGRKYTTADMDEIHHAKDPLPPLAVLAWWEDKYRTWHGHDRITRGRLPIVDAHALSVLAELEARAGRATVETAIGYLDSQLDHFANHVTDPPGGPDWVAFTKQIRSLRANLERALHDEREPEVGVQCFECGDRLVRRFREAKGCKHATPARAWFRVLLSYPELRVYPPEVKAALLPCDKCVDQSRLGGLDDPRAGRSWECPGCRKEYTPGEYATAVRRDLLENDDRAAGWTHIRMAAEAATTLVSMHVMEATVRKWMDRGKVSGLCEWTPGVQWGQRLVFWPDVAAEAVEAVARAQAVEDRRRERVALEQRFWRALGPNFKLKDARAVAKRLGIDKAWLRRMLDMMAA